MIAWSRETEHVGYHPLRCRRSVRRISFGAAVVNQVGDFATRRPKPAPSCLQAAFGHRLRPAEWVYLPGHCTGSRESKKRPIERSDHALCPEYRWYRRRRGRVLSRGERSHRFERNEPKFAPTGAHRRSRRVERFSQGRCRERRSNLVFRWDVSHPPA